MERFKPIEFQEEKEKEKGKENQEFTILKYQGQVTADKYVYSVYYSDKNFLPNNKYIFYFKDEDENRIEFTDGTEFPGNLKQRIEYELYKILENEDDNEHNVNGTVT